MTAARFQIILSAIAAVISLAGLADATYLTVAHLTGDDLVCGSPGGCSAVLGSVYASVAGIPTAAFGALAYFVAFSSATLAVFGYARARTLLMLVVMAMFGATLWCYTCRRSSCMPSALSACCRPHLLSYSPASSS